MKDGGAPLRLGSCAMSATEAISAPARARARLSALYALSFGSLGAIFPYLALELRAAGASALTVAVALSAAPVVRLVAGPVWGVLADRFRIEGKILWIGAVIALAGAALLAVGPAYAVAGATLMALGRAPLDTTLEGITLRILGPDPVAYGRVRLWGSIGFLLGALAGGLLEGGMLEAWAGFGPMSLGAALAGALLLLALGTPSAGRFEPVPVGPALRALWGEPRVRWFLAMAALHFLSHSGATAFLAVHLDALGAPGSVTGVAIAVGVGVEILMMANSRAIFSRMSPDTVLLGAVLLALPRWLLNAALLSPAAVVAIQALHGFTFGAFWVAATAWLGARAAPEIRTSAQALLGAAVAGVGSLGGNLLGGWLIEHTTTDRMFLGMALVSGGAIFAASRALGPGSR